MAIKDAMEGMLLYPLLDYYVQLCIGDVPGTTDDVREGSKLTVLLPVM